METVKAPKITGAREAGAHRRRVVAGMALAVGLLTAVGGIPSTAAASEYRLLEFGGKAVKWGESRLGSGARVTWAVQNGERHDPEAINCRHMTGVDSLLAKAGVSESTFRAQAAEAFAMWQAATDLTFEPAATGEEPDIVIGTQLEPRGIAWTNVEYAVPSQELALTRTLVSGLTRPVVPLTRAAICLNAGAPWKIGFDGNTSTYDLRHVLAHEIGHAIGLDHPGKAGQLMGFAYQENMPDLMDGDVSGAVLLYGPRSHQEAMRATYGDVSAAGGANENLR